MMHSSPKSLQCFNCGTTIALEGRIGRKDSCAKCDADLHSCLNCRLYNRSAHNECSEPQAEWVRDKDRANFCDYFRTARGAGLAAGQASGRTSPFRGSLQEKGVGCCLSRSGFLQQVIDYGAITGAARELPAWDSTSETALFSREMDLYNRTISGDSLVYTEDYSSNLGRPDSECNP